MTEDKQTNTWKRVQDTLANRGGVSVVTVSEDMSVVAESNNNSICQVLFSSKEFASSCAKFCGKAFEMAARAGKSVDYKCYAGLHCKAVPVAVEDKRFVAIVGRSFLTSQDYRVATQRAVSGDWNKFSRTKFFGNVILSGSPRHLELVAGQFENLRPEEKELLFQYVSAHLETADNETDILETKGPVVRKTVAESGPLTPAGRGAKTLVDTVPEAAEIATLIEEFHKNIDSSAAVSEKIIQMNAEEIEENALWRSLFSSLFDLSYKKALLSIMEFLEKRYGTTSLAWLETFNNRLEPTLTSGRLKDLPLYFKFSADDKRLVAAVQKGVPLELNLRRSGELEAPPEKISLFPIGVGGKVQNALIIGDDLTDQNKRRQIARFCRRLASDLEIMRLREELSQRAWFDRAVQLLNESVKFIDSDEFWTSLARILSDLLKSERSSLLLFDKKSESFSVKAATGASANFIQAQNEKIGERIAKNVLKKGKPFISKNFQGIDSNVEPSEWKYKSNSFISYPIIIADKEIGVLNVTDKTGGEIFDEVDLELLDAIVPHLAVLIDRALLKQKAGEYQHLSVTDPLTGLLNRRYLEERLTEEIQRSSRHGYPLSFMMIDVDDFKAFNDEFTHPEGDKALRIVGRCFKEILRGADVAARYGGEEFSILLPQTNSFEAETIAERIREKVARTIFQNRQVTISIGIVSGSPNINTAQDLIRAADTALYEAKRQGKNNVQIYEKLKFQDVGTANGIEHLEGTE